MPHKISIFAAIFLPMLIAAAGLSASEVYLTQRDGLYSVPVQINGSITLDFLVDSGSSVVTIPRGVLDYLVKNGTLTQNDVIGTGTALLADSSRYRTAGFVLREMRVGDSVVHNVAAIVSLGLSQPILGQSFLGRFGSVTFDNRRRILLLSDADSNETPPRPTAVPRPVFPPARMGALPGMAGMGSYGSFAYDSVSGRSGSSSNQPYWQDADRAALAECGSDSCQVVLRTGSHECGAVAGTGHSRIWGAAKGPTRDAAALAAMQTCQMRAFDRCDVRATGCNS